MGVNLNMFLHQFQCLQTPNLKMYILHHILSVTVTITVKSKLTTVSPWVGGRSGLFNAGLEAMMTLQRLPKDLGLCAYN